MRNRAQSFEDLEIYKRCIEFQQSVFEETKRWPKEEMYSLIDQVRWSSRAIGECIAEAWAKRRYPAHFISKLTDADGEQNETRHWLYTANMSGYLDKTTFEKHMEQCSVIGAQLGLMMKNAADWRPTVRPLDSPTVQQSNRLTVKPSDSITVQPSNSPTVRLSNKP